MKPKKFLTKRSHSESSETQSIRKQVFTILKENPLLTAKWICKRLKLPYEHYGKYVANLRSYWRSHYRSERGSICSSVHGWRGFCFVPANLSRESAVERGWVLTKSRNRFLLWKERLGRLRWFETDRVNLYVRKPANLGRAYQLVSNAFSYTAIISNLDVFYGVLKSIRFKGASYVFDTGEKLPYLKVTLFKDSNGVEFVLGDKSHPTSLEARVMLPDWAERNEALLSEIRDVLNNRNNGKVKFEGDNPFSV